MALALMIIKLIVICYQVYDNLTSAYALDEITLSVFIVHGIFLLPILLFISIIGLLVKGNIGFTMALVFPYFLISFGIIDLTGFDFFYGKSDLTQLIFALMVLIPINYSRTLEIFNSCLKAKGQIKLNILALVVGLTVNIAFQTFLDNYTF